MSRIKVVAAIAVFVLASLAVSGVSGKGTQSNPPPPASGAAPEQNVQAPLPPGRVHLSAGAAAELVIHQVAPVYPRIAVTARIQGTVLLHEVIGKEGKVKELQYISGPPLLMRSAMDAVRQWRYKPFLLKGEAVEVDTTVQVVFALGPPSADDALIENPALARKLQLILPGDVQVLEAAKGYKKLRDFEVALYSSRDLNIAFLQFRCIELGGEFCNPATAEKPKNATKTIETLKPGMSKSDVKNAVKKAKQEARSL